MSLEALLLALTSVVRPTSAAAVYAILSTKRPQHLLIAYIAAGIAFSITVGIVVLVAVQSSDSSSTTVGRAVLDLVIGAAALGYAAGTWAGRFHRPRGERRDDSWITTRLQNLTPAAAAAAGLATHLPGLVYLAALGAIVGDAPGVACGIIQVVIYNAIWFSLAIAALVMSWFRPSLSRDLLKRGSTWAREHQRGIIVGFFGVFGIYLVTKGILVLGPLRPG